MFLNKDKYRRQGATQVLEEMVRLKTGELITIQDTKGNEVTFKRVK
jgi:hypothetical protein